MSVTIGNGITLGNGITITSVTSAADLRWDPNYIGSALILPTGYGNITVFNGDFGFYTAIGTQAITGPSMFSVYMNFDQNANSLIGVSNHATNLNNGLGLDTNSIGLYQGDANVYWNDTPVGNVSTFAGGDTIDVAVNSGNIWFRINGGSWNNDGSADPATNTGGISFPGITGPVYPAVTIASTTIAAPAEFTLNAQPLYSVPAGYTFMAPNLPSFVITSSRLTNPGAFNVDGASFSNVSTSGFTMDTAGSLYSCYYAQVTYSDADIIAAFNAAGNTLPYGQYGEGYLWNPSFYGTQEEVPPIAKVGYDWTNSKNIYILPLDSGDPGAFDPGGGNGTPLTGTYEFPVIFTAFEPFTDKGGWC